MSAENCGVPEECICGMCNTKTADVSDSPELAGYKPGWYWVTHVSEGDTWYPIYVSDEHYLMDGREYELDMLRKFIVKPAILPTGL